MNLPDKFLFKVQMGNYQARKEGSKYRISDYPTSYNSSVWEVEDMEKAIVSGAWKIFETPNGVDVTGKPICFKHEQLKPGMRGVSKSGKCYVVMPNPSGSEKPFIFAMKDWWNGHIIDERPPEASYAIVEVYAQPEKEVDALDPNKKGNLIWKYIAPKSKEQVELEQEIQRKERDLKASEARIATTRGDIMTLKEKLAALQK